MRVTEVLTKDEILALSRKSNWAGLRSLVTNLAILVGAFWLVARWPNPLTVIMALILIGGRQLGCAVLIHDGAHKSLFRTPWLNRLVGRVAAAATFSDMDGYWRKHLRHHSSAGSHDDPDLENYRHYAVSKASFRRKILRDLTARTGLKSLRGLFRAGWRIYWPPLVFNVALAAAFVLAGVWWLYLLWIGSYLTTNMLFSRLRQAAEHAVVPDLFDPDPRQHTRTTLASWWERLTVAPNHVNYHLEHHLLPALPPHQLPRLHRLLRERGYYDAADITDGYRDLVGRLTAPVPAAAPSESAAS